MSTASREAPEVSVPTTPTTDTASDATSQNDLAVEAAMSLESLAWGYHPERAQTLPSPAILALTQDLQALVHTHQAQEIIQFHKTRVAWMHNVVYMPFFARECRAYLTGRLERDAAWLSLYCAVLCTGVYYMSEAEHQRLELKNGYKVAKKLYQITVDAIMQSDFMVIQSRKPCQDPAQICELLFDSAGHSLQAICVILQCAHALGDTRRMKVLVACAQTIGQSLGHRLHLQEDHPSSCQKLSFRERVDREVQKRLWCLLRTQDWYMIASKKSYSIMPAHGTTPLPANCREDFDDVIEGGSLADLPLSIQTQSTYMCFLFQLTSIYRLLFDRLCVVRDRNGSLPDCFDEVLAADSQLEATMGEIEQASSESRLHGGNLAAPWRTLVITSWHLRIMIHRTFFCHSFQNKRYHYSRFICLAAARKILRSYQSRPRTSEEKWTIPAHAISSCIIITLNTLFSSEQYTLEKSDSELMQQCLAMLQAEPRPNCIVDRGIQIVQRLLNQGPQNRFRTLDPGEMVQLAKDIDTRVPLSSFHAHHERAEENTEDRLPAHEHTLAADYLNSAYGHFGDEELFMPLWYDSIMHDHSL